MIIKFLGIFVFSNNNFEISSEFLSISITSKITLGTFLYFLNNKGKKFPIPADGSNILTNFLPSKLGNFETILKTISSLVKYALVSFLFIFDNSAML